VNEFLGNGNLTENDLAWHDESTEWRLLKEVMSSIPPEESKTNAALPVSINNSDPAIEHRTSSTKAPTKDMGYLKYLAGFTAVCVLLLMACWFFFGKGGFPIGTWKMDDNYGFESVDILKFKGDHTYTIDFPNGLTASGTWTTSDKMLKLISSNNIQLRTLEIVTIGSKEACLKCPKFPYHTAASLEAIDPSAEIAGYQDCLWEKVDAQ